MTYNDTILALVTTPSPAPLPSTPLNIIFASLYYFWWEIMFSQTSGFFWMLWLMSTTQRTILKVEGSLAKYERNGEIISINLSPWLTQDLCWDWWRWNFKKISIEYRVSHVLLLYTVSLILYSLLWFSRREGSKSFTHYTPIALGPWCHVAVWVSHYD